MCRARGIKQTDNKTKRNKTILESMDRKQEGTMAGGYRPRISRRGCREGFQFAEAERKFLAEPGPPGPSWGPEIQAL